jgi:chorismate mutase
MEEAVLERAIQALDESDRQILRLLSLRQHLAMQLAQLWIKHGPSVGVEERVSDVVSRLRLRNPGPLDDESLRRLFMRVIQATEPLLTSLCTENGGGKKG